MKAIWQDTVIAQSDDIVTVEGNAYFPAGSVNQDFLETSEHTSVCPWKGQAGYHHLVVEGKRNENAAWFYTDPSLAAKEIQGRVAFWQGVEVIE
jgi:uncharacterized protein (DUF427 family)